MERMLIVEDDATFTDYVRRGLTYEGYEAHVTAPRESGYTAQPSCSQFDNARRAVHDNQRAIGNHARRVQRTLDQRDAKLARHDRRVGELPADLGHCRCRDAEQRRPDR